MVDSLGDLMKNLFAWTLRSLATNGHTAARLALVGSVCLGAALPAYAQATAQIPLQFDFLNPGARSLALGSAFTAVADDATAAFTNPAGLTFLVKPEVSAELRYRRLETPFLFGGRISGTVTNIGQDTVAGPVYGTSVDSAVRPYFLSFVYPWRRLPWHYRHELSRQDNAFLRGRLQCRNALRVLSTPTAFCAVGTRTITVDNYGARSPIGSAMLRRRRVAFCLQFRSDVSFQQHGFVGGSPSVPSIHAAVPECDIKRAVQKRRRALTATPQLRFGAAYRQQLDLPRSTLFPVTGPDAEWSIQDSARIWHACVAVRENGCQSITTT